MQMSIGEHTPLFVVRLDVEEAAFCKHAAKLKWEGEKGWTRGGDWEGGYLAEFAMWRYLEQLKKRHAWHIYFGDTVEAPKQDIILWREGGKFTLGIRSRRHRDLERYPDNPVCFYPKRRLREPEKIADFVVMSSVKSNPDGGSMIVFWGAIPKDRLLKLLKDLPTQWYSSAGPLSQDTIDIPLNEFDPRLLESLLSSCDER
jgi:hypothetical protein